MEIEQQNDTDKVNKEDEVIEDNDVEINEVHDNEQEEFYLESEQEEEENNEITNEDETEDDEIKEIMELQTWAIQNNIPHTVLDSLLKILKKHLLPTLPMSAKTFLKTTSVSFNIQQFPLSLGQTITEFVYFGIAEGFRRCVNFTQIIL